MCSAGHGYENGLHLLYGLAGIPSSVVEERELP
jgi:hypothetical protein